MERSMFAEIDLIEEFKLRRWARENYVDEGKRETAWHPVVLEEMTSKDRESTRGFNYKTTEA